MSSSWVLITGASSGFALDTALTMARLDIASLLAVAQFLREM
jgi:NADP-dependent 3-hydroxy acid dehydrogenase YdfG